MACNFSGFIDQKHIKNIRNSLEKATSLPPVCYTNSDFYSIEEAYIFRKNWLCIGRDTQIPNVGDYFTIDLLNDPLVAVRDNDKKIRVMSRVCRHRWMNIVEGCGNSKAFKCPYHGWIYDLNGQLRAAPGMNKSEFDKNKCVLPALQTEIWQGFIFVNYDSKAVSLSTTLSSLNKKLDGYQIEKMKSIEPIVYESEWNWKVMVENASEVYHLGLHSNTLLSKVPLQTSIIDDVDGPYTYYRIPNKDRAPFQTSFNPVDTLSKYQLSEFVLCTVFPCHIMIINPDQMTWIQILPKTATSHTLKFHLCFNPASFNEANFFQKSKQSKWFLREIHEEDIAACRSVQKGLSSHYAQPTSFSFLEKSIWQFHNWILDQLMVG